MTEASRNVTYPGNAAGRFLRPAILRNGKFCEGSFDFVRPEIELPRLLRLPHLQSHLYPKLLELVSRRIANALTSELELTEIEGGTRLAFMDQISWVADSEKRQLRQELRNNQGDWIDTGLTFDIKKEFSTAHWIGLIVNLAIDEFTIRDDRPVGRTLAKWLESNLVARFQNDQWLELLREQVFTFCQPLPGLFEVIEEAQPLANSETIDSRMYSEYWAHAETWMELARKSPTLIHFYNLFVEDLGLPVGTDLKVVRDGCIKYGWKPSTWRFLARFGRECYESFFQQHLEEVLNAYNIIGYVEMQRQANLEAPLPGDLARILASVVQLVDIDDMPLDPRILKVGFAEWKDRDSRGTGKVFADTQWLEVLVWMRDTQPSFDNNQWRAGWGVIWRQCRLWTENSRDACEWISPLEEFYIGFWRIRPITDDISLANEGLVMKNCIGTFGKRCKLGEYRVFAIIDSRSNSHVATVGLEKEETWDLDQVKGKCNSEVDADIQEIARLIVHRYIEAEEQSARRSQTINYFEVQVDKAMGHTSMLWAKSSEGKWVNVGYDNYSIPQELIQKLEAYSRWFERYANDGAVRYQEHLKMRDFKRALALEIRRTLGPEYAVYLWNAVANRRIAFRKEPVLRMAA